MEQKVNNAKFRLKVCLFKKELIIGKPTTKDSMGLSSPIKIWNNLVNKGKTLLIVYRIIQ